MQVAGVQVDEVQTNEAHSGAVVHGDPSPWAGLGPHASSQPEQQRNATTRRRIRPK
jgi:hypothetical protein